MIARITWCYIIIIFIILVRYLHCFGRFVNISNHVKRRIALPENMRCPRRRKKSTSLVIVSQKAPNISHGNVATRFRCVHCRFTGESFLKEF